MTTWLLKIVAFSVGKSVLGPRGAGGDGSDDDVTVVGEIHASAAPSGFGQFVVAGDRAAVPTIPLLGSPVRIVFRCHSQAARYPNLTTIYQATFRCIVRAIGVCGGCLGFGQELFLFRPFRSCGFRGGMLPATHQILDSHIHQCQLLCHKRRHPQRSSHHTPGNDPQSKSPTTIYNN